MKSIFINFYWVFLCNPIFIQGQQLEIDIPDNIITNTCLVRNNVVTVKNADFGSEILELELNLEKANFVALDPNQNSTSISLKNVSNDRKNVIFEINKGTIILPQEEFIITYQTIAPCSLVNSTQNLIPTTDILTLKSIQGGTIQTTTEETYFYEIKPARLELSTNSIINAGQSVNTVFERTIEIQVANNDFNGVLNFSDNYGEALQLESISMETGSGDEIAIIEIENDEENRIIEVQTSPLSINVDNTIIIKERLLVVECPLNEAGFSDFNLSYGCSDGELCAIVDDLDNGQVSKPEDARFEFVTTEWQSCLNETITRTTTMTNVGGESAFSTRISVGNRSAFLTPSSTRIDRNSLSLSINGVNQLETQDYNLIVFGDETGICESPGQLLVDGIQIVLLNRDVEVNDVITLSYDYINCCPESSGNNGFGGKRLLIRFENSCEELRDNIGQDDNYFSNSFDQNFPVTTPQSVRGDRNQRLNLQADILQTSFEFIGINPQLKVMFYYERGLSYTTLNASPISIQKEGLVWNAASISQLTDFSQIPLEDPSEFQVFEAFEAIFDLSDAPVILSEIEEFLTDAIIDYTLVSNCDPLRPGSTDYGQAVFLTVGTSTCLASCDMLLSEISNDVGVQCPGCVTPGWVGDIFTVERTTFGLADLDGDRLPDNLDANPANDIDEELARENFNINRATFGDIIRTRLESSLELGNNDGGVTLDRLETDILGGQEMTFTIFEQEFESLDQLGLVPQEIATLEFRLRTGENEITEDLNADPIIVTINVEDIIRPTPVGRSSFIYAVDLAEFRSRGLIPNDLTFKDIFGLNLIIDYQITEKPEIDPGEFINDIEVNNYIFLSGEYVVPNTGDIAGDVNEEFGPNALEADMEYYCERIPGIFEVVDFYVPKDMDTEVEQITTSLGNGFVVCQYQYNVVWFYTLGKDLSNSFDHFPNEYRNFATVDELSFEIPEGYVPVQARILQFANIETFRTEGFPNVVDGRMTFQIDGDWIVDPVDRVFRTNTSYRDENGEFTFQLRLAPDCEEVEDVIVIPLIDGPTARIDYVDGTTLTNTTTGNLDDFTFTAPEAIPLEMTQSIPTTTTESETSCWLFQIDFPRVDGNAGFTNIYIAPELMENTALEITSLKEVTYVANGGDFEITRFVRTLTDNNGVYNALPFVAASTRLAQYELCAKVNCSEDRFFEEVVDVHIGYDCIDFPENLDQVVNGQTCSDISRPFTINEANADFVISSVDVPSSTEVCEPFDIAIQVANESNNATELRNVYISLPELSGLVYSEVESTFELDGTTYTLQVEDFENVGGRVQVNLDRVLEIAENPLTGGSLGRLVIKSQLVCGYQSEEFIIIGHAETFSCANFDIETDPYTINQLVPNVEFDNLSFSSFLTRDPVNSRNINRVIRTQVTNNGSSRSSNSNFIRYTIPESFSYSLDRDGPFLPGPAVVDVQIRRRPAGEVFSRRFFLQTDPEIRTCTSDIVTIEVFKKEEVSCENITCEVDVPFEGSLLELDVPLRQPRFRIRNLQVDDFCSLNGAVSVDVITVPRDEEPPVLFRGVVPVEFLDQDNNILATVNAIFTDNNLTSATIETTLDCFTCSEIRARIQSDYSCGRFNVDRILTQEVENCCPNIQLDLCTNGENTTTLISPTTVLTVPDLGASEYQFRVVNLTSNETFVVTSTSPQLTLDQLTLVSGDPAFAFNTEYSVEVAATIGANTCPYGDACILTTIPCPTVSLSNCLDAGTQIFPDFEFTATGIPSELSSILTYEFAVINVSNNVGTELSQIESGDFPVTAISNWGYGDIIWVSVRAVRKDNGEICGIASDICQAQIILCPVLTVQNCPNPGETFPIDEDITSSISNLNTTAYPDRTPDTYRFYFTNVSTTVTQFQDSDDEKISLDEFTGWSPGDNIRVGIVAMRQTVESERVECGFPAVSCDFFIEETICPQVVVDCPTDLVDWDYQFTTTVTNGGTITPTDVYRFRFRNATQSLQDIVLDFDPATDGNADGLMTLDEVRNLGIGWNPGDQLRVAVGIERDGQLCEGSFGNECLFQVKPCPTATMLCPTGQVGGDYVVDATINNTDFSQVGDEFEFRVRNATLGNAELGFFNPNIAGNGDGILTLSEIPGWTNGQQLRISVRVLRNGEVCGNLSQECLIFTKPCPTLSIACPIFSVPVEWNESFTATVNNLDFLQGGDQYSFRFRNGTKGNAVIGEYPVNVNPDGTATISLTDIDQFSTENPNGWSPGNLIRVSAAVLRNGELCGGYPVECLFQIEPCPTFTTVLGITDQCPPFGTAVEENEVWKAVPNNADFLIPGDQYVFRLRNTTLGNAVMGPYNSPDNTFSLAEVNDGEWSSGHQIRITARVDREECQNFSSECLFIGGINEMFTQQTISTAQEEFGKMGSNSLSEPVPSPVSNVVQINYSLDKNAKNAFIVLFDEVGMVLKQVSLVDKKGSIKLNTTEYESGYYYYSLSINGNKLYTQRMIILH